MSQPARMAQPSQMHLLLSGPHPRVGGGVVAHCGALGDALVRLGLHVQQVHVGAGLDEDQTLGAKLRGVQSLLRGLPNFARRARGQLVHLNPSFTPKAVLRDAALLIAAKVTGAPTVAEFHGGMPDDVPGILGRAALRVLMNADALVVINRLQERALAARYPAARGRLHRIPNGVCLPDVDVDQLIDGRLANPTLLYMGRLLEEKGVLDVIRAAAHLPGVQVDVAGDGPALSPAQALASELGIAGRVTFHGHVGGEAKEALLRAASLFVFPSYYAEGQPIVLLEALAWGIPVITCDLQPLTDLITPECGGLVPPRSPAAVADVARHLLSRPEVYAAAAGHNRALAEHEYDLELVARRFVQLYRQVQWRRT
ncbi:glycosyltransferase family 4 protein [Deinococcus marmoris]